MTPAAAGARLRYAVHGTNDGSRKAIVLINESTTSTRYSWHFSGNGVTKAVLYATFTPTREVAELPCSAQRLPGGRFPVE